MRIICKDNRSEWGSAARTRMDHCDSWKIITLDRNWMLKGGKEIAQYPFRDSVTNQCLKGDRQTNRQTEKKMSAQRQASGRPGGKPGS